MLGEQSKVVSTVQTMHGAELILNQNLNIKFFTFFTVYPIELRPQESIFHFFCFYVLIERTQMKQTLFDQKFLASHQNYINAYSPQFQRHYLHRW